MHVKYLAQIQRGSLRFGQCWQGVGVVYQDLAGIKPKINHHHHSVNSSIIPYKSEACVLRPLNSTTTFHLCTEFLSKFETTNIVFKPTLLVDKL